MLTVALAGLLVVLASWLADAVRRGGQVGLVVDHQSGKASVAPDQLLRSLHDSHRDDVDVITLTEVAVDRLRAAIVDWAAKHGWSVYHPREHGAAECAVLTRDRTCRQTKAKHRRLTRLRLRVGRKAPIVGLKVLIEPVRGAGRGSLPVWVSPVHKVAHVQGPGRLLPGWAAKVYRSALEGWAGLWLGRVTRVGQLRVGDINLHLHLDWVQRLLTEDMPRLTVVAPDDPTFGKVRTIDGGLTNVAVVSVEVAGRYPGLDHAKIRIRLGRRLNRYWRRRARRG